MYRHTPIKDHHQENRLFQRRILVAVFLVLGLSFILFGRLAYFQIVQHKLYTTMARANQVGLSPLPPNRGLIYDRNGTLIAENIPVFSLEITPDQVVGGLANTIKALSKIITISPENSDEFYRQLRQKRRFEAIPLKVKLTPEEVAQFSVVQYRFSGVKVAAHLVRYYPYGPDLVNALGYVGRINMAELKRVDPSNYSGTNYIGKVGIEKYFENQLHGTVGYQQMESDAHGEVVRVMKETPPIPGQNLYLTIDLGLQQAAERALGDNRGAIVVIQPSTGQVLALVSDPTYDPNLFVTGISNADYRALADSPDQPLYNRAVRGLYAPGSTVKPLEALQALGTNTITPTFQIFDPGWFSLPNSTHRYRDWKRGGHGMVNVTTAIMQSCDVFFYTVGLKMGIANINAVMSAFGFGSKTGIQMEEELGGIAPTPAWKKKTQRQPWYQGDTVITAIGQGYTLVTPLQLASAEATLAERGLRYQPNLLLKTQMPDGRFFTQLPVAETPVQYTPAIWNTVISALQGVTSAPRGTAYPVFGRPVPDYTVAGKTGTAQVYSISQKGNNYSDAGIPKRLLSHSWFAGFAPVDMPQIAIAVIVENSPHQATIVARKVLDYYFDVELKGKTPSTTVPDATTETMQDG